MKKIFLPLFILGFYSQLSLADSFESARLKDQRPPHSIVIVIDSAESYASPNISKF